MPGQRRKFTAREKLQIMAQANELGVTTVLREHKLSYSVYARWKQQILKSQSENKNQELQKQVEELQKENIRLKKIIANLALEVEIKTEELKKMEQRNYRL